MARIIAPDCGLPPTTEFCATNPVQLFDFSSLACCELPLKLLRADGAVLDDTVETAAGAPATRGSALALPVGDALQEPPVGGWPRREPGLPWRSQRCFFHTLCPRARRSQGRRRRKKKKNNPKKKKKKKKKKHTWKTKNN
eukprot:NODE_6124_length_528_cov_182.556025.p2 GENE.NODE_6124_length_528_cov_182.556025~~NODE_6124_length_528_cov_182.556025.p2  ORF type:complete len:140 (-),score=59.05 NODE_6124_length_528_cov_182.556025:5-424(-)